MNLLRGAEPSLEDHTTSANRQIPCVLWISKFLYLTHKNPLLDCNLRKIQPLHTITHCFFMIPLSLGLTDWLLRSDILSKMYACVVCSIRDRVKTETPGFSEPPVSVPRLQQGGHRNDPCTSTISDLLCKSLYKTTRRSFLDDFSLCAYRCDSLRPYVT
jgi:hypothetical protein